MELPPPLNPNVFTLICSRFDKDPKLDPIKVVDTEDEALVKLQNIERSLLELSQQENTNNIPKYN